MSELKVRRIDSPLTRTGDLPDGGGGAVETPPAPDPPAPPRPLRPNLEPGPNVRGHGEPDQVPPPRDPGARRESGQTLPEPPALDEELTLLSARVPRSLRAQLAAHTAALRARMGDHVSQKSLPEQEVLAVALWLLGSAKDPAALDVLARGFDQYRARRHAAAARNLAGGDLEEPDRSAAPRR